MTVHSNDCQSTAIAMATCLNALLVQKQSIIDFVFELVIIRRNPEVATQPLFFGKIEDVANEKSTLYHLS